MKRMVSMLVMGLWVAAVPAAPPASAPATAGSWRPAEEAFGRVSAPWQAVLRLPFAARITALKVEPGMRVKAGEELARFDAPLLRRYLADWQQARHAEAVARERLHLLQKGEKSHILPLRDLVQGEQALVEAQGKSRLAWEAVAADLDNLHLKAAAEPLAQRLDKEGAAAVARALGRLQAPFAGVVTKRQAALGEQLAAGEAVLELEALDSVYVDVEVAAASLPRWRKGESWGRAGEERIPLRPLDGVPLYDAATGLWRLRFQSDNPGLVLREGAWIEVEHLGAARAVVWVPASAVVARNGKSWCIVRKAGRFQPVEVRVGRAQGDRLPVLSGIAAGTEVVTQGAYELLYRDLKELIRFVD